MEGKTKGGRCDYIVTILPTEYTKTLQPIVIIFKRKRNYIFRKTLILTHTQRVYYIISLLSPFLLQSSVWDWLLTEGNPCKTGLQAASPLGSPSCERRKLSFTWESWFCCIRSSELPFLFTTFKYCVISLRLSWYEEKFLVISVGIVPQEMQNSFLLLQDFGYIFVAFWLCISDHLVEFILSFSNQISWIYTWFSFS